MDSRSWREGGGNSSNLQRSVKESDHDEDEDDDDDDDDDDDEEEEEEELSVLGDSAEGEVLREVLNLSGVLHTLDDDR